MFTLVLSKFYSEEFNQKSQQGLYFQELSYWPLSMLHLDAYRGHEI